MLGSNLLISDMAGMLKAIYNVDDLGLDQISTGNVIGFLMEAYEKGMIDRKFLDGIDLKWGSVDATLAMIDKIASRDGVGDLASKGVKALSRQIGQGSEKFAIHVKGHELAAHNIQANPPRGLCYVTANRGACHLNGDNIAMQNTRAMLDSTGMCFFPALEPALEEPTLLVAQRNNRPGIRQNRVHENRRKDFQPGEAVQLSRGFPPRRRPASGPLFRRCLHSRPEEGLGARPGPVRCHAHPVLQRSRMGSETTKPGESRLKELGLDSI